MDTIPVHALDPGRRAVTRALRLALIGSVIAAVILVVLLATASGNTALFERHYPTLLGVTIAIATGLLLLVGELVRRLVVQYRRGQFGTRLMARMAAAFVLMTVAPVLLVYAVTVQFVGRSIESWFDVPVGRALDAGLSLARASLDAQGAELGQKARRMAAELAETAQPGLADALSRLSDPGEVREAVLISGSGRIIASAGGSLAQVVPDLPPVEALRQARATRVFTRVESAGAGSAEPGLKIRVIVPVLTDARRFEEALYLQLVHPVPKALAEHAEAVQQGYRDFEELSLSRAGLKRIFEVTLALAFLLTVFSAVASAFLLAGWLTGPLAEIASATRSVAEGDFRPVRDYPGRDELGVLTRSFNAMTRQLQEARLLVQRNQQALEQANAKLGSVLANLDAGVLVLDAEFRLMLANPGADRILGESLAAHLGAHLTALPRLREIAEPIRAAFAEQAATGEGSWQRQFALRRAAGVADAPSAVPDGADQTLLARGSTLPERDAGHVIVFDDISEVISAQRALAWAEVARRLAHEITNPLMPIQLAAERMQLKLRGKLVGADAELLDKNAQTIVNQVGALKAMVDEFRDYARLPPARLASLALNDLVDDVLRLYAAPGVHGVIQLRLAEGLPPVMGDASQLRQVIHNLLKNALEAVDRQVVPDIVVSTALVELADAQPAVRLVVRDNGTGFAPAVLARAFEPYVTTKPRGTGLGLPIVRKIIDEHQARIDLGNWQDSEGRCGGAQVAILFTKLAKNGDNPGFGDTAPGRNEGYG